MVTRFVKYIIIGSGVMMAKACTVSMDQIDTCLEGLPPNIELEFEGPRAAIDNEKNIHELNTLLDICSAPNKESINIPEIKKCCKHCHVREFLFNNFCL